MFQIPYKAIPVVLLALVHIITFTESTLALEHDGITFPDSRVVEGNALVLNGIGTRRATIFGFRVYVAGLYLNQKSSNAEEILASPEDKYLVLHLIRSVSREDVVDAWTEGLENNVENPEPYTTQLNAITTPMADLHPDEQIRILFQTDKVELEIPRSEKIVVSGAGFGKALLSIWLGKKPPNRGLKRGLLGKE